MSLSRRHAGRRTRGLGLALALLVSLAAVPLVPTGAAEEPEVRQVAVGIRSFDDILLETTLYWPAAAEAEPHPAVLMTHGWAEDRRTLDETARWLAAEGYVVLAYDSRGFGASEGVVGLNGPDEVQDARWLVSWLASLDGSKAASPGPIVRLDAEDDPRIGMAGQSYGGAIQLLAAALDARIDAIAPDIAWNDLAHSLAPDGVVKRGWVDLLFWSGLLGSHGVSSGSPNGGGMDERMRDWYMQALITGSLPADAEAALAERSPAGRLANVSADVLLSQGWYDTLFEPDEAIRSHAELRGRAQGDTHLIVHGAGHGRGLSDGDRDHLRGRTLDFFARHLMEDTDATVLPVVEYYDPAARSWTPGNVWPPQGIGHAVDLAAQAGTASVVLAQAPPPSSHTEVQNYESDGDVGFRDAPLPTSLRVPTGLFSPVLLAGAPNVTLAVTPQVDDLTLFLSLVDVGPSGRETVVLGQVTPMRLNGAAGERTELDLELHHVVHRLAAGHTLELRITTSDTGYLGAREPGQVTLELSEAVLHLPLVEADTPVHDASEDGPGDQDAAAQAAPAPGPLPLLVVLGLLAATLRVRGRAHRARPDPEHS